MSAETERLRSRTARRSVPTWGGHWATSRSPASNSTSPSRVPATNSTLPERLRGGAISPKAPCPLTWNVCGAGPLGDRSLPRRSLGYIPESCYKPTSPSRVPATNSTLPERLRGGAISPKAPCPLTRNVCGAGPLGDRSLPRRSLGYIPESCYKPNLALQGSCYKPNLTLQGSCHKPNLTLQGSCHKPNLT